MSVEVSSPSTPGQPITHHFHSTPDHAHVALQAMNKLRVNSQLCDIELVAGAVSVYAHRVVLAAASAYFHVMFNSECLASSFAMSRRLLESEAPGEQTSPTLAGDLAEKSADVIRLQELDSTALQLLVEYSYTGEIVITEDNVQVLLPASSILQMASVREACCKFLMRQLHPSNCLGIRSFADAHSCGELHTRSHKFALQNFQEVCNTEEFLLLPFKQVEELISSALLNVPCEEKVFTAVIAWLKHDITDRKKHVPELLTHVRLPLLGRDFLTSNVDAEPLVRDNPSCHHLLLEALKYHLLPEQRAVLTSPRTVERQPDGVKPYLFACGGGSLFAIHSEVECYNPRTDRWMPVASMSYRRSRAGVTSLGRYLYVMGGYDGACDLSSCEMYNPGVNKWINITSMGTKRSCLGIGQTNGLIYCVGGYDGASCLSSVERYDPLTATWTSCPAMNTRRRYARVAVLDSCLYAMGGFDSTNYQCTVERLDPRVGKWSSVPPMMSRRSSCGAAVLGGMLYCVGGNDGTMCMSSAERFNPRRSSWEPITAMHSRRSTHEVAEIDGFLYALGGNDGSSSLNSMERYDAKLNKWVLVTSMLARRSSVGAAVLDCLQLEKGLVKAT